MKYASFGSVSHGTMRTEDLLEAFASELEYQIERQPRNFKRREYRKLITRAKRLSENDPKDIGSEVVNELFDALDQFAPPYGYFGAIEGDGADYGYWLSSNVVDDFDGLKVNDTSEVPRDYQGEVLHVNDHGNVSLYVAGSRGKLRWIWAIV